MADQILEVSARQRFQNLTSAEITLLSRVTTQWFAVCGVDMKDDNPGNDPVNAQNWGAAREVRTDLLRWLCVDRHTRELIDPAGIQLYGARIIGEFDLSDVALPFALTFRHCAFLNSIVLGAAQMPELDLQGSWVQSIYADRLKVTGSVFFRHGFRADGPVRLVVAQIGGNLEGDNSGFQQGLNADGIRVSGSIFLRKRIGFSGEANGCTATSQIRVTGAVIDGNLECDGAHFTTKSVPDVQRQAALNANGAIIKGDVLLRDHFRSDGGVQLVGAQVGGDVNCSTGDIDVLDARRASIRGALLWMTMSNRATATLNLSDASAYGFYDDSPSWPSTGHLHIDGFIYATFFQTDPSKHRLEWLARQTPFTPQPYRQLAKVMSDSGREDEAQEVLMQMQKLQRDQHWYQRPESWVLRWSIGYGYHPLWAFWELVGLTGIGWVIYRRALLAKTMVPSDSDAYRTFKQNDSSLPESYIRFSPLVYSVENSLPLVKLGQADRWQPDPNAVKSSTLEKSRFRRFVRFLTSSKFVQWFLWVQIILGWILATLFAAGVTGIIRK